MRMIRERGEARWLPSRYHFALFRLGAYMRLRRAKPEPRPGLALGIDHDQSAFESYSASFWLLATVSCYFFVELARHLVWPVALLLSIPMASFAIQIPLYLSGGLILPFFTPDGFTGHAKVNSVLTFVVQLGAASYYATSRSWVRFAAWQFLALLALNALAAVILFLLRGDIARLESAYGGTPSEP